MKSYHIILILLLNVILSCSSPGKDNPTGNDSETVNIVFVSDSHYGISREFNGKTRTSDYVNSAMLKVINSLPGDILPDDKGVGAGSSINGIEFIVHGGDVSNRQENGVQSSAESWNQFKTNFINKITTLKKDSTPTDLFIVAGNHDVSNAIGHYRGLNPETDPTALCEIYNLMMQPDILRNAEDFSYDSTKTRYAVNRFGIRFLFINIWPGKEEREWMSSYLDTIPQGVPAVIFTHDEAEIEYKHLSNPFPPYGVTPDLPYENVISDRAHEHESSVYEQREFAEWLKKYPSVKAYFHGNTNYNEFYTYTGPDNNVSLPVFRVDSPMKGEISAFDQSKLSFQVITINEKTKEMTVRECLWARGKKGRKMKWGESKTIQL